MISEYSNVTSWTPLTESTPCGIFIGNDPCLTPYWIVRTEQGKIAVRLNETKDWTRHSHIVLTGEPSVYGRYVGLAALNISERYVGNGLSYPSKPGVLYHKDWWLSIKLRNDDGSCKKYRIAGITMNFTKDEVSYRGWDLHFGDEYSYLAGRLSNYANWLSKPARHYHCDKNNHNMTIYLGAED